MSSGAEQFDWPVTERTQDGDVVTAFHRGICGGECHLTELPRRLSEGFSVAICTFKRKTSLERFLGSLALQRCKPDRLVIVDASPDADTERVVRYGAVEDLARCVLYFRVRGQLKGLTRQRNFALRWVGTDLVAFFDDDVVLLDDCLEEMVQAHRRLGESVVGVGGYVADGYHRPGRLWRLRRLLRLVPDLRPGRYYRCGISIPWGFLGPNEGLTEGDWLSGCAAMWKTSAARAVRFEERFAGYGSGEDLDFSLRVRPMGKLLVAGRARVLHLHEPSGRPGTGKMAFMDIYNAYAIHRYCLPDRTRADAVRFACAFGVDALVCFASLIRPGHFVANWHYLSAYLRFGADLIGGRLAHRVAETRYRSPIAGASADTK